MRAVRFETSGRYLIKDAELRALALADHVTGVHIGPELLRGSFVWAEV